MKCKYCDKELIGTEAKIKMCMTCYNKLDLVRQFVAKCNEIKRRIGYDR